MSAVAKYQLTATGDDVHGRFGQLYGSGTAGKSVLLSQCVAGGMMLKETGLLDLIVQLDSDPGYRTASASDKRSRLLVELRTLFGAPAPQAPAQPQPAPAPVAAAATVEPAQPAVTDGGESDTLVHVTTSTSKRPPAIPRLSVGQSDNDE